MRRNFCSWHVHPFLQARASRDIQCHRITVKEGPLRSTQSRSQPPWGWMLAYGWQTRRGRGWAVDIISFFILLTKLPFPFFTRTDIKRLCDEGGSRLITAGPLCLLLSGGPYLDDRPKLLKSFLKNRVLSRALILRNQILRARPVGLHFLFLICQSWKMRWKWKSHHHEIIF